MTDQYDEKARDIYPEIQGICWADTYNAHEGIAVIAHALRAIGQERDKYKAEADHFKAQCSYMNTQMNNSAKPASEIESERDSLKAKLDIAREALGFYADGQWEGKIDRLGYLDSSEWKTTPAEILDDAGAVAREALEKIRG